VKTPGKDLLLGGLFLALAIALPVLFHALGLGKAFLPMFFPIIISGFFLSLPAALAVGLLSPLTSALLTGMPPFYPPIAFIMMLEGFFLAGLPVLLYQRFKISLWPTLITTILVDRLLLLGSVLVVAKWLDLPEKIWGAASLIEGIPGVLLILLLVPPLVKKMNTRLEKIFIYE